MVYLWFSLFILSIAGNTVLIWYVRKLINQFKAAIESVAQVQAMLDEYAIHLDTVSQMESYYGDVTIENLMKHTKDIVKVVRDSGSLLSLTEIDEQEEPEEINNANS